MISKELLNAVLDIDDIEAICVLGDEVIFNGYLARDINIYELAHKCKEWLHSKGYMFKIEYPTNRTPNKISLMFYGEIKNPYHVADTEIEAIFKACEWIIKQETKNE